MAGFPVTVVARAAEAWITTLEQDKAIGALDRIGSLNGFRSAQWVPEEQFGQAMYLAGKATAPSRRGPVPRNLATRAVNCAHGTWWDRVKADPLDEVMGGRFTRLFPYLPTARFDQR